MLNKIHNMDCVEGMRMLPDESVDLTVTSPPYDNLRRYHGFSWDFEATARELYRVTKPGGVVVWVAGDATIKGSETGTSFRQALYFMEIGFRLHDTMIYAKNNPIPQNHNRYEQSFEYMFVFSKGKPKAFHPIMEPTKNAGKALQWGNRKTVMDANQCRRDRGNDVLVVKSQKPKTNIFFYNIGGGKTGHPAVFPEQLAADHILSWSNPGDIVLDPFIGSGTTAKMAILNSRNFIGFDSSAEYCEIANKRAEDALRQLKEDTYVK